jgi:hypothetical protein
MRIGEIILPNGSFNMRKWAKIAATKLPAVISDDEMEIFQFSNIIKWIENAILWMCGRHKLFCCERAILKRAMKKV